MARPIRYIQQVIPTDFGNLAIQAMQNRQNQYDTAFSDAMQAEDQFGQLAVDPSDIDGKNTILNAFKDRTRQIVDKYGGDYGAASKELASEITKTRSNPFFQVAEFKRTRADEERRKMESLGANAIVVKSISNTPVLGPDGRVVSKDQLESKIYDKRQLMQDLAVRYGNIVNQQRDEKVEYKIPGYATKVVRTGLLPEEVAPTIEEAVQKLKASYGDVPEETLRQIASEYIPSLVGGHKTQELQDNRLSMEGQAIQNKLGRMTLQQKQLELDNLKKYGNPNGPGVAPKYSDRFNKGEQPVGENSPGYDSIMNSHIKNIKSFNEAVKDIDKYKNEESRLVKSISDNRKYNGDMRQWNDMQQRLAVTREKLKSARAQYVNAESSIGKEAIDSYIKAGLTKPQAINAITRQLRGSNSAITSLLWDKKLRPSDAVTQLSGYGGEFTSVDDKTGKSIKSKGGLYQALTGKNVNVIDAGYDMGSGSMAFKVSYGDKEKQTKIVYAPLENIDGNIAAKAQATAFNSLRKASTGLSGIGVFIINPSNGKLYDKETTRKLLKSGVPDGAKVIQTSYNKDKANPDGTRGGIESTIVIKQRGENSYVPYDEYGQPITLENEAYKTASLIGEAFGVSVDK